MHCLFLSLINIISNPKWFFYSGWLFQATSVRKPKLPVLFYPSLNQKDFLKLLFCLWWPAVEGHICYLAAGVSSSADLVPIPWMWKLLCQCSKEKCKASEKCCGRRLLRSDSAVNGIRAPGLWAPVCWNGESGSFSTTCDVGRSAMEN